MNHRVRVRTSLISTWFVCTWFVATGFIDCLSVEFIGTRLVSTCGFSPRFSARDGSGRAFAAPEFLPLLGLSLANGPVWICHLSASGNYTSRSLSSLICRLHRRRGERPDDVNIICPSELVWDIIGLSQRKLLSARKSLRNMPDKTRRQNSITYQYNDLQKVSPPLYTIIAYFCMLSALSRVDYFLASSAYYSERRWVTRAFADHFRHRFGQINHRGRLLADGAAMNDQIHQFAQMIFNVFGIRFGKIITRHHQRGGHQRFAQHIEQAPAQSGWRARAGRWFYAFHSSDGAALLWSLSE